MNLPTDVEKHLTKSIVHFMIKILSKLELEDNFSVWYKVSAKTTNNNHTHTILSINIILMVKTESFRLFQLIRGPRQCNNSWKK